MAQFCCTSLWFAGNGIMNDIVTSFNFNDNALAHLTSSVQFGFIFGTFVFGIFTISDRYSPSKVFLFSGIIGALFNLGIIWEGNTLVSMLILRFFTGFFLAGIYPVGMKIAADYHDKGLGKSLGFLVGALVLGTAFPHLLKEISGSLPWKSVLIITSSLAILGGLLMILLVPDGPYRKAGQRLNIKDVFKIFKNKNFRMAAFGYFGHMWELYAFWAFVPIILKTYKLTNTNASFSTPLFSFLIIGIGGLACILGAYIAQNKGVKKTAFAALVLSCICCLMSPFVFSTPIESVFLLFLFFWGMVVIADSPLFSTLVAKNASAEIKGTALTIVNCIGFFITIISIQILNLLRASTDSNSIYAILAIGPIIGIMALVKGK
ncbi:MFS transporter [uncultured Algibacter sp.]|uniref:MFS transporter n=1 Tax=uncultured Algibacter sp. TaxID=298659 RepID=UPI0032162C5A